MECVIFIYFQATKSDTGKVHIPENQQKQQFSKRRKKVYKNWQKDKVFALESDALAIIKNERIWTKYTTNRTDKWSKVIFRCRNVKSRGQQCEAGIYLLYSNVDPTVTLFRSINKHTCDSIESKRKRPIKLESKTETKSESDRNPVKTGENQPMLKRRRKTVKNWQKEKTFELEDEAIAAVKNEKKWAKYTTNKTDKGNKVIYRCRNVKSRGPQCEAGVYLLYSLIDPIITLFRSVNRHTCDTIESKRKPYVRSKSKTKIKTEPEKELKNDENQKKPRRRKKVVKNWQKETTFELQAEALEAVKIEQTWTKYTTNKTDKGSKVIYRCRNVKSKGKQCDAGVYLLYATNGTVTLYRSANIHTCDIIESKSKTTLNDEAKYIIRTEYEKGSKPKHILGIVIANGHNCRQIQINNYLAQLRRDAHQSTVFTLKDFANTLQAPKTWAASIDDRQAIKTNSKKNYTEN